MSLVPVNFGDPNGTVSEFYPSDTLAFPPPSAAINAAEAIDFADSATGRNRLHIGDAAENVEIHEMTFPPLPDRPSNAGVQLRGHLIHCGGGVPLL